MTFQTRIGCAVLLSFSATLSASAAMPYSMYVQALKTADQEVIQKKKAQAGSGALSTSLARRLLGRFYQVGDRWEVATLHIVPNEMRMTGDPEQLSRTTELPGVFRYEVIAIRPGEDPEVDIQITPLEGPNLRSPDPRVAKMTLTASDRLVQSKKTYTFKSDTSKAIAVSPDVRTNVSILELFPLDVPDVVTAREQNQFRFPDLPSALRPYGKNVGYPFDPKTGSWFEQNDFFGRPVQVFWKYGEPWPAYMRTHLGVALLIKKETL